MKYSFIVSLLITTFFVVGFNGCGNAQKTYKMKNYTPGENYDADWKQVHEYEGKGLTQDAKAVVEKIYDKAKKEKNDPQMVKSILHLYRYIQVTEENSQQIIIKKLKEEIAESDYPTKPVLQSILAEAYWQYLQQNRYRIMKRTELSNGEKLTDFETWDIHRFTKEISQLYIGSLQNSDDLKSTAVDYYDPIISKGQGGRALRPTLYDLLAHRALQFFRNDQAGVAKPADQFEIDKEAAFADAKTFASTTFASNDNEGFKFRALKIYQELTDLHLNREDPNPLIEITLQRLDFVHSNTVLPNKESLYLDALESVANKYKATASSTDALLKMAQHYQSKAQQYKPDDDNQQHKNSYIKAIEICEQAIENHPASKGAISCKYIIGTIKLPSLQFQVESKTAPEKASRALLKYKNIEQLYAKVVVVSPKEIRNLQKKQRDKIISYLQGATAVETWSQTVPNPNDYHQHRVEGKIPALPFGHYAVVYSTHENFKTSQSGFAYGFFQVTNLSYITRQELGKTVIHVLHRDSGEPLAGVDVAISLERYDRRKSAYVSEKVENGQTDKDGRYVSSKGINSYNSYRIKLNNGKDFLEANARLDGVNVKKQKQPHTFFFTDRSIYRPGQTLHFKGIMYESKGKERTLMANTNTTVELYDVNYQKVTELKLRTNEFGSFQGKFTLPNGLLNGSMQIKNQHSSKRFRVEEYKRPKFEVKFEPVKGSYRLNETVSVKGTAKAYAGSKITDAQVSYRVVRRARFPYWGYWWRPMPVSPEMEITNGTTTTNDKGEYEIKFTAIPDASIDPKKKPQFTYTIYTDVTDVNGETRSSTKSVSVGYVSLLASVEMPSKLNKKEDQKIAVKTTNLGGEFESANVNINVYELKQPEGVLRERLWQNPDLFVMDKAEFKGYFPHDIYNKENDPETWEKGATVYSESIQTTAESLLEISNLPEWNTGKYLIELTTKDKYGEAIEWKTMFTVFSFEEDEIPNNDIFWTEIENAKLEPGENLKIGYGSACENAKVLLEVEHDNVIVTRLWIPVNKEQKIFELPIEEKHRGNLAVHLTLVKYNRLKQITHVVNVPWSNKELDFEWTSFRNKLNPAQKEEWQVKITGHKGTKVATELLASMYDASLDAFTSHSMGFNIYSYNNNFSRLGNDAGFSTKNSQIYAPDWRVDRNYFGNNISYDHLNLFGFYLSGGYGYGGGYYNEGVVMRQRGRNVTSIASPEAKAMSKAAPAPMPMAAPPPAGGAMDDGDMEMAEMSADMAGAPINQTVGGGKDRDAQAKTDFGDVQIRKNLQETAFFMPELRTNAEGEIIIAFTAPEALTKWKLLGVAHTKDLAIGTFEKEMVTQKDLMVMPNVPRFLRENDEMYLTTKVANLTKEQLNGSAVLKIYDALTMQAIDTELGNTNAEQSFTVNAEGNASVDWKIKVPVGTQAITYQILAKAGNFSDGEENALPVLTNRMLVTESMPLPVRGKGTHEFDFENLQKAEASNTLVHHNFALEFTSNPAWYAVQALPYLMEYPHTCTEQIFSRYYANSIASHVANSNPKIKKVFETWTQQAATAANNNDPSATAGALLSNLEKNQELKQLVLEETPWVLQAQNETERKKRIGLLFELDRMARELSVAEKEIIERQSSNGGFSWFPGMEPSRYITQHIVAGMGHLEVLGVRNFMEDQKMANVFERAVQFLDKEMQKDYDDLKRYKIPLNQDNISHINIHYLYTRSYFSEMPVNSNYKKAFNYWKKQAEEYWLKRSKYSQGMIALALHRFDNGDNKTSFGILESLRQNATQNEEMGMYFKDVVQNRGWYWHQAPIETQALLIEAFSEIENDMESVEGMKVWLLKNKQTNDWKTTKATVEACYALLLQGTDLLADDEIVEVIIGKEEISPETRPDLKTEAGTGYYKTSWDAKDIRTDMRDISVNKNTDGVAWGAVYWQYFEQLDKITVAETPLNIKKELFLEEKSSTGPKLTALADGAKLNVGDLLKVRVEIRVDREMEYVHLKDMRAAGFEPVNVISRYKYQDGLGYYESTKDAATNFFIYRLPVGTFVFEYPLRVSHKGDFSNGITTMQCMYAPEFSAHSEGIRVVVE